MADQDPSNLGQRVARTETDIAALRTEVKSIADSVQALVNKLDAKSGVNWGAMSVLVVLIGGAVGGAYQLQSKENERIYTELAHNREDVAKLAISSHEELAEFSMRYDHKMEKLDANDSESARDRTATKESLREIETQFRLGRENTDLRLELERTQRDLAIERATHSAPKQQSAISPGLQDSIRTLRTEQDREVYSERQQ